MAGREEAALGVGNDAGERRSIDSAVRDVEIMTRSVEDLIGPLNEIEQKYGPRQLWNACTTTSSNHACRRHETLPSGACLHSDTPATGDFASARGSGLRDRDRDLLPVLVGDEHGLKTAAKGSGVRLERGESEVLPSLQL